METDLITMATQFGVSGLIAWMWLTERRAAQARERDLTAAHDRLIEQRVQLDALMALVADNTKAVSSMESALRSLAGFIASATPSQPGGDAHNGPQPPRGTL